MALARLATTTTLILLACSSARVRGELRDRRTGQSLGRFDVEAGAMVERPGYCPVEAHAGLVHLSERIFVQPMHAQVGFDSEVRIEPELGCGDEVRWRQVGGPRLGERMRIDDDGVLVIRTHPIPEDALDGRIGVVALSPAQRGDYRFEAEVGDVRIQTRVTAAPAATGLYQVATGADVYLEGEGAWSILAQPEDSHATIEDARFRPQRFGTYLVRHDASGTEMSIQAGAYDEVPRDCGRVGCHRAEAEGWRDTAHATNFRRGMEGELGAFEERCWACHATGVDPGVINGGLHHTAQAIGFSMRVPEPGAFDALPRRVRRHGSVWCSACHGPGRIVPPQFRWQYGAKLQVGVCARCHEVPEENADADHVSSHVAEWRLAPMSRFTRDLRDDDPAVRPQCTRCHSAQGFIEHVRRGTEWEIDRGTVEPITCAVCHDPHSTVNPVGLRMHGAVGELELGRGAICASCHDSNASEMVAPHAPQTDLLAGRGARLVDGAPGPHARAPEGCVTCHMAESDGRAGGHTFAASTSNAIHPAACAGCHGGITPERIGDFGPRYDRALETARSALASKLRVQGPCGRTATQVFEHEGTIRFRDAAGAILGDCDDDGRMNEPWPDASALPRAVRDVAHDLVMIERDGSRGRHNPTYSLRILSAIVELARP